MITQTQSSKPKRARGICPVCGHSVRLAKDGLIGGHLFFWGGCSRGGAAPVLAEPKEAP